MTFEEFASTVGKRLRAGLIAAYGPDLGLDVTAEALAYGWEHWPRVSAMENPAGYLYRVAQTAARRAHRRHGFLPPASSPDIQDFEPRLLPALEELTETQRTCVVMVHAYGWGQTEVAELLEISPSSVRTHIARALDRLQRALEVSNHAE